ncbi:hypothetical protein BLNAU_11742 [Blattamonas nauphoetae]|uniref:Uncharacterized protein n=1 Tax=Blattamonas nauphoetae TaxID=2049346 RepID=A0ABQ9XP24_9EUKA|nr:hypothetical protein BLNAU_11742 [Blattamonas nauphoetae]
MDPTSPPTNSFSFSVKDDCCFSTQADWMAGMDALRLSAGHEIGSVSSFSFSMDCSAFLNWDEEEELESESEIGDIFQSLVATIKLQPGFDDTLETKAVKFLESVYEVDEESADAFLGNFGETSDDSPTDFVQSIVVLLSSSSQAITTATMKMLKNVVYYCSAEVLLPLVEADLIPQLINTLHPLSLSPTEAVDIPTSLISVISDSLRLATPYGLEEQVIEDDHQEQAIHETKHVRTSESFELFLASFGNKTVSVKSLSALASPRDLSRSMVATLLLPRGCDIVSPQSPPTRFTSLVVAQHGQAKRRSARQLSPTFIRISHHPMADSDEHSLPCKLDLVALQSLRLMSQDLGDCGCLSEGATRTALDRRPFLCADDGLVGRAHRPCLSVPTASNDQSLDMHAGRLFVLSTEPSLLIRARLAIWTKTIEIDTEEHDPHLVCAAVVDEGIEADPTLILKRMLISTLTDTLNCSPDNVVDSSATSSAGWSIAPAGTFARKLGTTSRRLSQAIHNLPLPSASPSPRIPPPVSASADEAHSFFPSFFSPPSLHLSHNPTSFVLASS